MQLRLALVAASAVLVLGGAQPASAAVCVLLALGSGTGTLGPLTANNTVMSSEVGGTPASFTAIITLGSSTITVAAPTAAYIGTRPHSGEQPQVKWRAANALGGQVAAQDYTNASSSFGINALVGLVTTTVHGKITNPSGFSQGDYQLKTVVTCS